MNPQKHSESGLGWRSQTKHYSTGQPIRATCGPWDLFPLHLQGDEICCGNSLISASDGTAGTRLPDTSSNGWAVWWLSLSLSSLQPNALMKCHECPFRNYLKLLTSPNLFIWHLSPLLRGTTGCCFPVWLQKCSSDFNTELMLCVNWMFSMLTFKGKHRKQASRGLIGYIKHKLHGTISKVAERSCRKNITSSFDLFFLRTKSDQQKLKIWHSLDSFT